MSTPPTTSSSSSQSSGQSSAQQAMNQTIIVTETRNLKAKPFLRTEDQIARGKLWEEWIEEIEREFRYFR